MEEEKRKVDHRGLEWIEEFDEDFMFIRSVLDVTGNAIHDAESTNIGELLLRAYAKAVDVEALIHGLWESIQERP